MVLPTNAENNMGRTCKQVGSHKENKNKRNIFTEREFKCLKAFG